MPMSMLSAGRTCIRALALAMCVMAAVPATAAENAIQKGIEMVRSGDHTKALAYFEALAQAGESDAMYHLGALHHSGLLGAQNVRQALYWYRKAADAGVPDAKFALGSLFYKGKGVERDMGKALNYIAEAAEGGMVAAQFNLAMMHAEGLAHTKEYGADQDRPRAYKWFTIVLDRLGPDADREPAEEGLKFLVAEMTRAEIVRGQEMADAWLQEHPKEGNN